MRVKDLFKTDSEIKETVIKETVIKETQNYQNDKLEIFWNYSKLSFSCFLHEIFHWLENYSTEFKYELKINHFKKVGNIFTIEYQQKEIHFTNHNIRFK